MFEKEKVIEEGTEVMVKCDNCDDVGYEQVAMGKQLCNKCEGKGKLKQELAEPLVVYVEVYDEDIDDIYDERPANEGYL